MRSQQISVGPKFKESVLVRHAQRLKETQGKTLCGDGIRVWSDRSTSQEMPVIAGSHQKLGDGHGAVPPSGSLEETYPASTLMLSFWHPEL